MPRHNEWTDWQKFSSLFEYHGLVWQEGDPGNDSTTSHKVYEHLGKTGTLHTDDGFRLRSMSSKRTSFPDLLTKSLEEESCLLKDKMVGCYHIRILIGEESWNYIGQCAEKTAGMRKRITTHFRKLCNIPEHPYQCKVKPEKRVVSIRGVSSGGNKDKKFKKTGKTFRKEYKLDPSDPEGGFWEYVQIRFVHVDPSKSDYDKKIEKLEGLAIMALIFEKECLPELNSRNELIGMENFSKKLDLFIPTTGIRS